jgi:hypothetical protein
VTVAPAARSNPVPAVTTEDPWSTALAGSVLNDERQGAA